MLFKGLCIIPEGSRVKGVDNNTRGVLYSISVIKDLKNYLKYANYLNLGVLYLSVNHGVVYADDEVTPAKTYLYKFTTENLNVWSKIVSEQLYRECINHGVSVIHLMIKNRNLYHPLVNNIKSRGVRVELPLLGDNREKNVVWEAIKNH